MRFRDFRNLSREMKLYIMILALTALALGFSNDVLSNYFKDVYNVTAYQRGVIEFPREIPGMLCLLLVGMLAFLSDIKMAMVAQALSIVGISALGLLTPSFSLMLFFVFINSLGMHLFFPLQDSIGLALAEKGKLGKQMGQFKGVSTAFQMFAGMIVFLGFRMGIFSFTSPIKWIFLLCGATLLIVFLLLFRLHKWVHDPDVMHVKMKFVMRRDYKYYYILVVMFGVQKQIMMVYGPWVLIDLLGKKVDTLAILFMLGSFIGIFFIPALGRWIDRFGVKAMLYADALSFIGVYLFYGLLCGGYQSGLLAKTGWPLLLAYGLFIIDRMSSSMGIIRTVYLRKIAVLPTDITPTLSVGVSMDHVVSILCAYLGGIVWTVWGPQYIFYLASALSLVNLYVAIRVKMPKVLTSAS
jgi:MFS family permease